MNWFELSYYVVVSTPKGSTSISTPVSSTAVRFLNPTNNLAYTVAAYKVGGQMNEYEVQVDNKTDVLIEWTEPSGTILTANTNTGWGYTSSTPDYVWLK